MFATADAVRRLVMVAARSTRLDALAQPWLGGVGVILMLHRVTAHLERPAGPNAHLAVAPAFLDAALEAMKRDGFRFVSLDEAVDRLRSGASDERFAAVTADDGYRDNLLEALPVLEAHDAPFTVYVAPGLIDGLADLWWDVAEECVARSERIEIGSLRLDCVTPSDKAAAFGKLVLFLAYDVEEAGRRDIVREMALRCGLDVAARQKSLLMTWGEVERLAAHRLATIGAHTLHHYNLRRLPLEAARRELEEGNESLARRLGSVPRHFAFPYGYARAVGPREIELAAEAGFASAVTTRHGVVRPEHAQHLHALPRISLNGRFQQVEHVRTMVRGFTTPLANAGRRFVTV